jgi:hypothetical protein
VVRANFIKVLGKTAKVFSKETKSLVDQASCLIRYLFWYTRIRMWISLFCHFPLELLLLSLLIPASIINLIAHEHRSTGTGSAARGTTLDATIYSLPTWWQGLSSLPGAGHTEPDARVQRITQNVLAKALQKVVACHQRQLAAHAPRSP